MDSQQMELIRQKEIEILDKVVAFCNANCLQYSLAAGTALGAFRHQGFIPWDDDIDITMTRPTFMRMYEIWQRRPIPGLTLQYFLDDPYCGTCHAKIRMDGTILLSKGEDEKHGHHGIWIDIFPMDKISDKKKLHRKTLRMGIYLVLLTRVNVDDYASSLTRKLIRKVVRIVPYRIRKKWMEKISDRLLKDDVELNDNYHWISMSAFMSFGKLYNRDVTENVKEISFEGKNYDVFWHMEDMLTVLYGNYMELPPEEKRIPTHSPIKIKCE